MKLSRWTWVLLAGASCRPAATGALPPAVDPCRISPDAPASLDTITVAFTEGENEAGRMVSRLSGQTLVRVDCQGRTGPLLARSWTRDASGTTWTFELDSSVSAATVVAQWDLRRNGGLWPWTRILEVRALPLLRMLEVRLDSVFSDVPPSFAIPELSVAPAEYPATGRIRIQVYPPTQDGRDLLDRSTVGGRGVDLLITRDRNAISYAGSKPDFSVAPLAWDRVYVVVAPVIRPELGPDLDAFRSSLVRGVVQADSRTAVGPVWWETSNCAGTTPLLPMGRRREVVYLQGDETARQIAERLVALQRTPLRAAGLLPDALLSSLAGGEAALYVVSLPRTDPGSCGRKPAWPSGASSIPLVDSRAHALVRAGVPGFTIEGDGTIGFDHVLPLLPSPPRR